MKKYIKAGFGVTIGFALADLALRAFSALARATADKLEDESKEKKENE